SESLFFTFTIALNALLEETFGLAAQYVAEAFEHDLQEDAAIALFVGVRVEGGFVVVDPVAVDQAQLPAAAVVFETAEGFECAVACVVMLPAGNQVPLRNHWPDDREVMLLHLVVVLDVVGLAFNAEVAAVGPGAAGLVVAHGVVAIAIAGVDHLVRIVLRLVVEHDVAGARLMFLAVPVELRG